MKFLSAPWRWKFISRLAKQNNCIFCDALADSDKNNLICFRGQNCIVILNKYPYSTGHLMIAPNRHIATPEESGDDESQEIWKLMNRSISILREQFQPDGFNLGMNLGKSAGAGIADHYHIHVVPRWQGDSNFMPVIGKTRVASYDLEQVFQTVKGAFLKSF